MAAKRDPKHPKKNKKKVKKHLKNENFENEVGFFSFFYPSCEFKKMSFLTILVGGEEGAAKCHFFD